MAVRVLVFLAAICAAAHALAVHPKVDLPGVVRPRRPLGTDILDPEKVQAVLQVKVKSAHPDSSDTKVNAVVCLNSDSSKCSKKNEPSVRPSVVLDEEDYGNGDEEEEVNIIQKKRPILDEEEEDVKFEEDQEDEEEEKKAKRKQVIIILDEDPAPEEKKKSKRKKVGDVPVIVGYNGVTAEEESKFHDNIHIPSRVNLNTEETIEDVPVYTGLKLSPEFDKQQEAVSYLNPPPKDVPVTFKQIPQYGFEESALVAHIFETSPLIKALQEKYISNLQHRGIHRVASLNPRVAVSEYPDYVAGVDSPYHHQPVPGFYGGHQPRIYPNRRGVVRPGAQGCYYPSQPSWNPSIRGKVAFTGEEEEITRASKTSTDTQQDADTSGSPVIIKVDGKLGGPLENQKT